MLSRFREMLAVLAALAVLIVGTTCTQAGCLLPRQIRCCGSGVQSCCCCCDQGAHRSSEPKSSRSCPTCGQTLFAKASLSNSADHPAPDCQPLAFLPAFAVPSPLLGQAQPASRFYSDIPPPQRQATLLSLSCS